MKRAVAEKAVGMKSLKKCLQVKKHAVYTQKKLSVYIKLVTGKICSRKKVPT